MSRLPVLKASVLLAAVAIPSIRQYIYETVIKHVQHPSWKTAAILLALANLKSLPFVWHIRVLGVMFYQLRLQRAPIDKTQLFQPVIVPSRSPLFEIDYNLHKSNSTYFADFDEARSALVSSLLRTAISNADQHTKVRLDRWREALGNPDMTEVPPGRFGIYLGAVACQFKREVPPYKKVEIWTRMLSWDRKWMYWISYVVEAGVNKPTAYTQQPWKKGRRVEETADQRQRRQERAKKSVYAVSIAKYVVKKGRLTVPPELVLRNSDMLPDKPERAPPASQLPSYAGTPEQTPSTSSENILEESLFPSTVESDSDWTWAHVETERVRGLKFAEHFAALDGMLDTFDGGEGPALSEYSNPLNM